ncbi:hypothetical protein M5689_009001 [Euphorbia peplus]|nr:hypothetical protein M5689_009001 [Euphorbia peplus]
MEAQQLINLFDSCWFGTEILAKQSNLSRLSSFDSKLEEKKQLFKAPSMISRSMSDQLCPKTSFGSDFSMSPDSVLHTPKLQTILSGKEITDEEGEEPSNSVSISIPSIQRESIYSQKKCKTRRRSGKKNLSKSLSELEFEEVKGFMDLGFVFSEEDKDSSLVSIIPGLQRLGKREIIGQDENDVEKVSRPYLSEAWEVLEKKEKEEPLMNWRIPAINNDFDMKQNIKFWAQTVASAVR